MSQSPGGSPKHVTLHLDENIDVVEQKYGTAPITKYFHKIRAASLLDGALIKMTAKQLDENIIAQAEIEHFGKKRMKAKVIIDKLDIELSMSSIG